MARDGGARPRPEVDSPRSHSFVGVSFARRPAEPDVAQAEVDPHVVARELAAAPPELEYAPVAALGHVRSCADAVSVAHSPTGACGKPDPTVTAVVEKEGRQVVLGDDRYVDVTSVVEVGE